MYKTRRQVSPGGVVLGGDLMPRKSKYASLYTLRKDGRYQGSYTDETGRHYVYDRDPEKLYEKLQAKQQQEVHVVTFKEAADGWETEHRAEITDRTWKNYAPHLKDIVVQFGDTPIEEMEAADVANDLARAKAKGYSATIVNTRRSIFQMIFDYAVIQGYIKYNPVSSVKLPRGLHRGKRQAPTDDQIKIICQNIDKPFGLFPFFLLCTGMRRSEALALTWDDIDLKNKVIHVTKSVDYTIHSRPRLKEPKTKAGIRNVPILDILFPYLKGGKGQVFPQPTTTRGGPGGGIMTEGAYNHAWEQYCQESGLTGITAHNIRHGTATLMFELDVDELTAQRILGHSRVEITREIYTDLRNAQLSKSVSKFNDGMSKMMSKAQKY